MLNKYPDKSTYKTTITAKLRDLIMTLGSSDKNYLELGCDVGYTVMSVAKSFKMCCGIDIDNSRIEVARKHSLKNCEFVTGTAASIVKDRWDVVLIDADHSYESVKSDFETVISRLTPGITVIIFHDYGLVAAGVKKFVTELEAVNVKFEFVGEQEAWNPLGGAIAGPEAAMMILQISDCQVT